MPELHKSMHQSYIYAQALGKKTEFEYNPPHYDCFAAEGDGYEENWHARRSAGCWSHGFCFRFQGIEKFGGSEPEQGP